MFGSKVSGYQHFIESQRLKPISIAPTKQQGDDSQGKQQMHQLINNHLLSCRMIGFHAVANQVLSICYLFGVSAIDSGSFNNINALKSKQYCRHFADDIFHCTFLNQNVSVFLFKCNSKGGNDDKSALVCVVDWCLTCNKPLPKSKMPQSLDAICCH